MDFTYEPLKAGETRLLRITPAPAGGETSNEGRDHAPLYTLIHVELTSEPTYSALSYTWGSLGATETIQIDGKNFAIRPNLLSALAKLEGMVRATGHEDHCFWIDAICINQGTSSAALAERSAQIVLMPRIYDGANAVFVWLGEPVDVRRNDLAYAKMRQLGRKNAVSRKQFSTSTSAPLGPLEQVFDLIETTHAMGTMGLDDVPNEGENSNVDGEVERRSQKTRRVASALEVDAWIGILELWKRPYWSRTWVIQEATINEPVTRVNPDQTSLHDRIFFLCGDECTGWESIEAAYYETWFQVWEPIFEEQDQECFSLLAEFKNTLHLPISTLLFFRKKRTENDPGWDLLELLERARPSSCQDPHDKVWAILPLVYSFTAVELPDYEKITILDLYTRIVAFQLKQTGKELDFLGHTGTSIASVSSSSSPRMPSWLPDWSKTIETTPIPKALFNAIDAEHPHIHNPKGEQPAFNASGGKPCKVYISGSSLHVEAVFVDTICDLAIKNPAPGQSARQISGWLQYIEDKYEGFDTDGYLESIVKIRDLDLEFEFNYRPIRRYEASPDPPPDSSDKYNTWNLMHGFKPLKDGRQLCLTTEGQIGVVPLSAIPGDYVAVLLGGRVMYTLRPVVIPTDESAPDHEHEASADQNPEPEGRSMETFEYIGEAYLHGLMDGVVMEWEEDFKVENIEIV